MPQIRRFETTALHCMGSSVTGRRRPSTLAKLGLSTLQPGTKGARVWPGPAAHSTSRSRQMSEPVTAHALLTMPSLWAPLNTLAEYGLNQIQQPGFLRYLPCRPGSNVPMELPAQLTGDCTRRHQVHGSIKGQCPAKLRAPGGCNNPCTGLRLINTAVTRELWADTGVDVLQNKRCPDANIVTLRMIRPA
ncbi:Thaumatin-like protein [Sesamum angolense]|uniref:Thaumatin-like protein n=1 Tax=Sesamum angolense TaxID=2727404 RepID=A0AAE1W9N7_9LAMI|nr:Thaumatin-like protein [Sesamum angolense]